MHVHTRRLFNFIFSLENSETVKIPCAFLQTVLFTHLLLDTWNVNWKGLS